jgi:hypothetical protein
VDHLEGELEEGQEQWAVVGSSPASYLGFEYFRLCKKTPLSMFSPPHGHKRLWSFLRQFLELITKHSKPKCKYIISSKKRISSKG